MLFFSLESAEAPTVRKNPGLQTQVFALQTPPITDHWFRRSSLAATSPNPTSKARAPTDTREDTKDTPPVLGSRPPTAAEAELPPPP
jgi:hypothetical protein